MNIEKKKLAEDRLKRIEERKKFIKSKKERKMLKYSDNFNEMFNFFLKSYRKDILTFCGSIVNIKYDINSEDGKFSFRLYENGNFKQQEIISSHPNILKAVITAKKSWGLWCEQFSDGIAENSFTKHEILEQFKQNDIIIPDVFLKEFENKIWEARFRFESSVLGKSLKNDIKENPKKYIEEYNKVCKN
jgi:hypothetical protein